DTASSKSPRAGNVRSDVWGVCLMSPVQVKKRAASRAQRVVSQSTYARGRSTSPLGTFGTKYVDLGGMTSPAAATAHTSSTLVGLSKTAAAALPARTASNAARGSGV